MNSPDHSTKGTPSGYRRKRQCLPFDCLWVLGFRDSFIPLAGCFSPFPHGTRALSVANRIEPWRVVPPASHRISRVPWYSGVRSPDHARVGYGPLTLSGSASQPLPLHACLSRLMTAAYNPTSRFPRMGLGSSRFARHYSGNLV